MSHLKAPLAAAVLAASVMMSASALAATETWTFNNSGDNGWNSWSYNADSGTGPSVGVGAYSDTGDVGWSNGNDDTIENAWLTHYSGSGLGVINNDTGSGYPDHAFDGTNGSEWENMDAVLFSFSEDVTLTSVTMGWHYQDYDFSLLVYTGADTPDVLGQTYSGLLSDSWSLVGNFYGDGTNDNHGYEGGISTNTNATMDVSAQSNYPSSYYLLSVLNPNVGGNSGSAGNDVFKLLSVSGTTSTPTGDTPGVPVPATALLFALGLPLLRILRKRS